MQGFPVHHQLWKLAPIHVHWVSDAIQLSHPLSSHYLILCHPILLHALLDCKEILVKLIKIESESDITQSCPTLCDPMECSLPCSSIHGIFQARVLEWIAISFSRGSSGPRDWTWVSHITGRHFTIWATREACSETHYQIIMLCLWNYHTIIRCTAFIYRTVSFSPAQTARM